MYTFKNLCNKMKRCFSCVTHTQPQMSVSSSAMEDPPNWMEMPDEVMANILQRLGTKEILNNAWKVCTTWRRICKDPAMWKVIDVQKSDNDVEEHLDLERLTKKAIDLSCGELIDISISGFGNDDLLDYIFLRSGKLKRVSLTYLRGKACWLTRAPKRFPQLEELHISLGFINVEDIEVIGRNCPQLKSFTVNKVFQWSHNDDHALAVANYMPELRHLDLCGSNMTNDGLEAILIGCPHLESLDVRMCSNLNLKGNLGKLCTERIKDFMHPNDSSENCRYLLLSYEFYHELHVFLQEWKSGARSTFRW